MKTIVSPIETIKSKLESLLEENVNLILWNDDTVYFKTVIEALTSVLDYSRKKAENKMLEAHKDGSAQIHKCSKNEADILKEKLESYGLSVSID